MSSFIRKPDYSDAKYSDLQYPERYREYERDMMLWQQQNELVKQNELRETQINQNNQLLKNQAKQISQQQTNVSSNDYIEYENQLNKYKQQLDDINKTISDITDKYDKTLEELSIYNLADLLGLKHAMVKNFIYEYLLGFYKAPKTLNDLLNRWSCLSKRYTEISMDGRINEKLAAAQSNKEIEEYQKQLDKYKYRIIYKLLHRSYINKLRSYIAYKQSKQKDDIQRYTKQLEQRQAKLDRLVTSQINCANKIKDWLAKAQIRRQNKFIEFRQTHYNECVEHYLCDELNLGKVDTIKNYGSIPDYTKYITNIMSE